MKCANYLCIYEKNGKCTLHGKDAVSLDAMSRCEDCIYPDLPRDIVEREKKKLLDKFDMLEEEYQKRIALPKEDRK